jgi:hypothetical protein
MMPDCSLAASDPGFPALETVGAMEARPTCREPTRAGGHLLRAAVSKLSRISASREVELALPHDTRTIDPQILKLQCV